MAVQDSKEQMDKGRDQAVDPRETNSGNPNVVDPTEERSNEHKGSYGGEGGKPRTSSDSRQGIEEK
jgi:hypothetical protein